MKAVTFDKFGGPEVLRLSEIKKPTPKSNEALVKIHAASVTAEDPKMRAFNHPPLLKLPVGLMFGFKKPKRPVLGMEFSGTIEAVGDKVKTYKVKDEVFGYTGLSFGAHAEYKCMPDDGLMFVKPRNLSFAEAATIVNGPLSALVFLKKKGGIKKGDRALVYGASGSVGVAAVQLAKYFGAHVTAVCSAKNAQMVKSLGADRVIDYAKEDFTESANLFDIIFDTVGKTSMKACMKALKPGGKYLLTEFNFSHILAMIYTSLFKRKKVIVAASNMYWKKQDLIFMKELAENGHFKPVIDRRFPLEKIAEAHKYVESGRKAGNVAILIAQENPEQM